MTERSYTPEQMPDVFRDLGEGFYKKFIAEPGLRAEQFMQNGGARRALAVYENALSKCGAEDAHLSHYVEGMERAARTSGNGDAVYISRSLMQRLRNERTGASENMGDLFQ